MSDISVIGAGAFGTALAIALARAGRNVTLVARTNAQAERMDKERENRARLPGHKLPSKLAVTASTADLADTCLLAVPAQALGGVVAQHRKALGERAAVACCKGLDLATGLGPTEAISNNCPSAEAAVLSGPGFAQDIAAGLPTAMTIAASQEPVAERLQNILSAENLRLYRSTDVVGVEMGGALKNVIAIGAGVTIGAGLGESARAALITRGFAEMTRLACSFGARSETLSGLSGLGDLVLTCTSEKSRNFRYGLRLGAGQSSAGGETIEGASTAIAVTNLADKHGLELPLSRTVASLLSGKIGVTEAVQTLLARPLRKE